MTTLPLHALLEALAAWRKQPGPARLEPVKRALEQTMAAHGASGVRVVLDAPPLPGLSVVAGDLRSAPPPLRSEIQAPGQEGPLGTVWVSGPGPTAAVAAAAIATALGAAWALAEARAATGRLEALDGATRAIVAELGLDRVLQLVVDEVRPLVGARYAALEVFDREGRAERFLTSGVTPAQRARVGHPPVGRGLLGRIVREGRSYRVRDVTQHPDRFGFPDRHPPMHSFLGVPVRVGMRPVGNLYLTEKQGAAEFSASDERLVESFALHAGIAIQNAKLHARVQELAVVEDRERIGNDLHDGIIQELYGVSLSLEDVPELLAEDPAEAGRRVERAISSIHATIRDIRNFIYELQPDLLAGTSLSEGVASLVEDLREDTGITAEVRLGRRSGEPTPRVVRETLAILSEALSNVARHARASSVMVELGEVGGGLRLRIVDDGVGLPAEESGTLVGHQGLRNMRTRAERLGGTLRLGPGPGRGTEVSLRIGATALRRVAAKEG